MPEVKADPQTPREMLNVYRQQSPAADHQLIESFGKMQPSERMEFLFYMMIHTNRAMGKVVGAMHRMTAAPQEAMPPGAETSVEGAPKA